MLVYDIVIIGKGISALTAMLYAAMSKKSALLIGTEKEKHRATGVNRYIGNKEDNYETFYKNTWEQLSKFTFDKLEENVHSVDVQEGEIKIQTDKKTITAKTVIVTRREDTLKISENAKTSKALFYCGNSKTNNEELVSLAGTGSMAAIDARLFLATAE